MVALRVALALGRMLGGAIVYGALNFAGVVFVTARITRDGLVWERTEVVKPRL